MRPSYQKGIFNGLYMLGNFPAPVSSKRDMDRRSNRRFGRKGTASDGTDPFDALPKSVWKRARNNGLVMIHRPAPVALSSRTRIIPQDEPGQPLIIEGQLFTPDGTTPAEGITVYAYNTDAEGYYGADHKEYPPCLYGWMKTEIEGRFELHTIFPGHYPGMQAPAHVHFTVWGGSYPPQWI